MNLKLETYFKSMKSHVILSVLIAGLSLITTNRVTALSFTILQGIALASVTRRSVSITVD